MHILPSAIAILIAGILTTPPAALAGDFAREAAITRPGWEYPLAAGIATLFVLAGLAGLIFIRTLRRRGENLAELEGRMRELAGSEARLRAVIDAQAELVCRFRPDGSLTFVNEAYCRYVGRTREKLIGRSLMPHIPKEDWQLVRDAVSSNGKFTAAPSAAHRVVIPDTGEVRWLEWSDRAITDPGGEIVEFQSVGRDVTERILMEGELIESETLFRGMFESHAAVMFLVDHENARIVDANEAAARFYGYPRETLAGMKVGDLDPLPEDEIASLLGRASDQSQSYFAVKHRLAGGEVRDVEIYSTPIRVRGSRLLFSIAHDVTERLRMEEHRRLSEERLAALVKLNAMLRIPEDEVAVFVIEKAVALTHSGIGFIGTLDANETAMTAYPFSESVVRACGMAAGDRCFDLTRAGIWAEAVRTKLPVVINDYPAPNPLKRGLPGGHAPLARLIAVPVVMDGRVVMVAAVANKKSDYDGSDVNELGLLLEGFWRHIERKRTEDLLRMGRETARVLLDGPELAILLDPSGKILETNPSFGELVGRAGEDLVGAFVFDLFPPDVAAWRREHLDDVCRSGTPKRLMDKGRDGRIYDTLLRPIMDAHGRVEAVALTGRDVTEMKHAEAEREKLIAELERALESVNTLSGLIPICSSCKRVRDDQGYWSRVEEFLASRFDAEFASGVCPDCSARLYPGRKGGERTIPALSKREKEVLYWVSQGKSTGDIAALLGISESTVKFHVSSVMKKLDAVTRSQAVAIAIELDLLNQRPGGGT